MVCDTSTPDRFNLHSLFASDDDTKSGGRSEALLTSGNDNVDTPVVHPNLLARDSTDSIENDKRFGGDPFHGISHRLRVRKHT
jgi:hypothetical protein